MDIQGRSLPAFAQSASGYQAGLSLDGSLRGKPIPLSRESHALPLPGAGQPLKALSLPSSSSTPLEFKKAVAMEMDKEGKKVNPNPKSERKRIHKAAQDFEALMLGTMLKQVWKSMGEDGIFGQDRAGEFYREMFLDKVSEQIASGHSSLGVAKVVEDEMLRNAGLDKPVQTVPRDATGRIHQQGYVADAVASLSAYSCRESAQPALPGVSLT